MAQNKFFNTKLNIKDVKAYWADFVCMIHNHDRCYSVEFSDTKTLVKTLFQPIYKLVYLSYEPINNYKSRKYWKNYFNELDKENN